MDTETNIVKPSKSDSKDRLNLKDVISAAGLFKTGPLKTVGQKLEWALAVLNAIVRMPLQGRPVSIQRLGTFRKYTHRGRTMRTGLKTVINATGSSDVTFPDRDTVRFDISPALRSEINGLPRRGVAAAPAKKVGRPKKLFMKKSKKQAAPPVAPVAETVSDE
jgi:hypothetical protein